MLNDEDIRSLIALKSEPNLDYKAGFAWTKDNRNKKYEIVRDLMALSNTKDGGRVIFVGSAPGRSTPSRPKGPLTGESGQIAALAAPVSGCLIALPHDTG